MSSAGATRAQPAAGGPLIDLLEDKRICICAGAGGVGKTTTSAAIAMGMAARGLILPVPVYLGAEPPMGSNMLVPVGLMLPPAAMPSPPCRTLALLSPTRPSSPAPPVAFSMLLIPPVPVAVPVAAAKRAFGKICPRISPPGVVVLRPRVPCGPLVHVASGRPPSEARAIVAAALRGRRG